MFYKPYLILFGGNVNNEVANDVWTFNSESSPLQWVKLDITENIPPARVYHSAGVCSYGGANGMMVVFGGRKKDGAFLNDMWGLRRHRNGLWDWMKAPYKGTPKDRLQHTSLFCGQFFINIGGRSSSNGDNLPIEVYDTESSEWSSFTTFKRFRHSAFLFENYLYIQGGLEDDKHNNPAKVLNEINLLDLFQSNNTIYNKIKNYLNKIQNDSSSNKGGSFDKSGGDKGDVKNVQNITVSDKAVIAGKVDSHSDFSDLVRICSLEK